MAGDHARSGGMVALLFVAHRIPESLPACIFKVWKMVGWISGHQQRGTFVHVCDIYLAWLCKGLGTDGWSSIEHDTTITPFHRHNDDLQGQSASSQTMPARSDCCRNTNNLGSCQCQRQRQRTKCNRICRSLDTFARHLEQSSARAQTLVLR